MKLWIRHPYRPAPLEPPLNLSILNVDHTPSLPLVTPFPSSDFSCRWPISPNCRYEKIRQIAVEAQDAFYNGWVNYPLLSNALLALGWIFYRIWMHLDFGLKIFYAEWFVRVNLACKVTLDMVGNRDLSVSLKTILVYCGLLKISWSTQFWTQFFPTRGSLNFSSKHRLD